MRNINIIVLFVSLLLLIIPTPVLYGNQNKIITELIENTKKELLLAPYMAKAYYSEILESKSDSSKIQMDAIGFYFSMNPPKNNAMLHKFFLPYNIRKSQQGKSWIIQYNQTCKKNQLRQKTSVPPDYANLISNYRWFLKGGPFSSYSKHYEFILDSTYIKDNITITQIKYSLKNPIGRLIENSGSIFYSTKGKKIMKIVSDKNTHFSGLFHKNIESKLEIIFAYTTDKSQCYFSRIKSSYLYKGTNAQFELHIENPVKIPKQTESEIRFLRYMNNRPYIIYNAQEWASRENQTTVQSSIYMHQHQAFITKTQNYYYDFLDESIKNRYTKESIKMELEKYSNIYHSNPRL